MLLRSAVNDGGRRAAIEVLADNYGGRVLEHILDRVEDVATAYAVWIEVFVLALREYKGLTRHPEPQRWLKECADQVLKKTDHVYLPYLLCEDIAEGSVMDSPPRPKTGECMRQDVEAVHNHSTDKDSAGSDDALEVNRVPVFLRLQLSQWLWATTAQLEAERRHRGPIWTPIAMIGLCLFAVAAIGFGVFHRKIIAPVAATPVEQTPPETSLPATLDGVPAIPLGQFPLTNETIDMEHLAFVADSLLTGVLAQPVNDWPQIDVERIPMRSSGKSVKAASMPLGKIDLVPPFTVSSHNGANGWSVNHWRLSATDHWVVAVVDWVHLGKSPQYVKQLYTYYMPTKKAALVRTFALSGKQAQSVTVVVGHDQVVVQRGLIEQVPGSSAIVSLPIHVYMLQGKAPIASLRASQTIPASFGLMAHPVVTSNGIYFQGINGVADKQVGVNEVWYSVNSHGQMQEWQGAPADGRPHWIVLGQGGNPYWVETTPDPTTTGSVEVLMSPLLRAEETAQFPASTLSNSVRGFAVLPGHLVWIQDTHDVSQLVVEQVN